MTFSEHRRRELLDVWGRRALWLLAAAYLIIIPYSLVKAYARAESGLRPTVMEFTPTYGASLQLREQPASSLYEREPMLAYTKRTLPEMYPGLDPIWRDSVRYPPWLYPPHFIFLVVPLALLPYWWAYVAWVLVSAVPYIAAIRRILPSGYAFPFALAFPPVFYNAFQAQTGFLTAGLIGLGLTLVRRRPVLAGLCIGAASIKPHFGLLIPLALIAGGYLRVAAYAALTILMLAGASIAAFDVAVWEGFFASASTNLQGFESETYNFVPMTTVLSTFALAGADLSLARAMQFVSFLAMTGIVGIVWWRRSADQQLFGLQCAVLCLATPLAVPMAYIYDLVLIAPAVAWLGKDLSTRGATTIEWMLLVLPTVALLGVVTVAHSLDLQFGPAILAILLGMALHRFRSALGACRRGAT